MLRPMGSLARPSRAVVREAPGRRLPERPATVATEVNHQLLGQNFHLLDGATFHGAPGRLRLPGGPASPGRRVRRQPGTGPLTGCRNYLLPRLKPS